MIYAIIAIIIIADQALIANSIIRLLYGVILLLPVFINHYYKTNMIEAIIGSTGVNNIVRALA